jgi:hypothetical protein
VRRHRISPSWPEPGAGGQVTPDVNCGAEGDRADTKAAASTQAAPLLAWGLASFSAICSSAYSTPPRLEIMGQQDSILAEQQCILDT